MIVLDAQAVTPVLVVTEDVVSGPSVLHVGVTGAVVFSAVEVTPQAQDELRDVSRAQSALVPLSLDAPPIRLQSVRAAAAPETTMVANMPRGASSSSGLSGSP